MSITAASVSRKINISGMVACASRDAAGNLTESGQQVIKAASIIATNLYDYDQGSSYGVAFGVLKDANGQVGPSDLSLKVGLSSSTRVIRSALSRVDEIVAGSVIGEVADLAGRVGITDAEAGSMDTIIPLRDVWDYVSAKLQHDVSKEPVGEYERIAVAAGDAEEEDAQSDEEGDEGVIARLQAALEAEEKLD